MATAVPRFSLLPTGVRFAGGILGLIGIVLGVWAWALASAPGGSPDDDYHLASTWCPPPLAKSGCLVSGSQPKPKVKVPQPVGEAAACYRFQPNISAGCIKKLQTSTQVVTERVDSGDYPGGFYKFQHLFVSGDIDRSVVLMRLANATLGMAGVIAAAALAGPTLRRNITIAALVSWVPMGFYLVASNNPSSWAITGVFTFAAAGLVATQARGWRLIAALGVASYGVILACTSRADAAIFCIVVAAAIWTLTPISRRTSPVLGLSVLASIAGALTFISTGQANVLEVTNSKPPLGPNQLLFNNIVEIPDYLAGLYGLHFGPGWFDVRLYALTTIPMIMLAGAVLLRTLGDMSWRKALAMSGISGVLIGLPIYLMVNQGLLLTQNQPRYLLPLLAVLILVGLIGLRGKTLPLSLTSTVVSVVLIALANSAALHANIRRYVTGQDVIGFNLQHDLEWWWQFGPTPMQLWVGGSLAFLIGLIGLAAATYIHPQPADELS